MSKKNVGRDGQSAGGNKSTAKAKAVTIATYAFVAAVVVALVAMVVMQSLPRLSLDANASCGVYYTDDEGRGVVLPMDAEDAAEVVKMLNGKVMRGGKPGGNFSRENALCISGSLYFCLAQDGSGTVYYEQGDQHFRLSAREQERLGKLLRQYGVRYPADAKP